MSLRPALAAEASQTSGSGMMALIADPLSSHSSVSQSVAWAVSALAERDACDDGCRGLMLRPQLGSDDNALENDLPIRLAELMLTCLSSPSRAIADASLDYFSSVNTVG